MMSDLLIRVKVWCGKSMRVRGQDWQGRKKTVLQGQCVASENIHIDVSVKTQNQGQHRRPQTLKTLVA
jgi:hypothetical protein